MKLSAQALYERYKKIYDSMYTFSLCREDEVEDLVSFIDVHWKKGHALVRSRRLLDWQYHDPLNPAYHFVLARHRDSGEIHAVEGFIPTTQFDPAIASPMTWGAIWKAVPGIAPPGLGFVAKRFRETAFATKDACEVGISTDADKYNQQFGNTVFPLENWYFVNPFLNDYRLIETTLHTPPPHIQRHPSIEATPISPMDWNACVEGASIPEFKSKRYYTNRYFAHPVYSYHAMMLSDKESGGKEILFYRIAEHDERKCIFIVDFIGDGALLSKSGSVLLDLVETCHAEYLLFPRFCAAAEAMWLKEENKDFKNFTRRN